MSDAIAKKNGEFDHKGDLSWKDSYEELKRIIMDRAAEGAKPRGDFQMLQGDFIDYTEQGELIVKFPLDEWQCNSFDVVQGGVLSYMADATFGALGQVSFSPNKVATLDLTSNFLRGVDITVPYVETHTHVLTKGKNIVHMACKLYNPSGKLVLHSTTNMMKVQSK